MLRRRTSPRTTVPEQFFKFPRTPHLGTLGSEPPRGDKLLGPAEASALLHRPLSVEEKVDGAGIGISISEHGLLRAQSRGDFIVPGTQGQFQPLWSWLATREERLRDALGTELILFGEWCCARHSVAYDRLPDWFLAFDVFEKRTGRFWSRRRRDDLVLGLGLSSVPLVCEGIFDFAAITRLMGPSRVGSAPMEGLVLRADDGTWLLERAKLVRPGWVQAEDEHWSKQPLVANRLAAPTATNGSSP